MMSHSYANVHRGLHTLATEATDLFEAARETVRAFLNAPSVDQIIFTRSSTGALNLVASGLGQLLNLQAGDEIILSILEHHSNIVPWHFWREKNGVVIKWAPVTEDGTFDLAAFEALITPRTKIVALTHMSNVTGTTLPIPQIAALTRAQGIPLVVDGSQSAVHLPIDVQTLGADFYCMTGHKLYAPTGIGVLYGSSEWLERLPPFEGGGEMIRTVTEDTVTYNTPPHRFEAGTPPIIEAVGLGAALCYMETCGRHRIAAYEQELRTYAYTQLKTLPFVRLIGAGKLDDSTRGAIFSFALEGAHAHDVATIVDRYGVAVRAGTHCAMPLLKRFGETSTCRASFAFYNTFAEVDALVIALAKAHKMLV
jgi:cysteine desulfurase / selenocysteine lyase